MFPDFYEGPICLMAWVQIGGVTFEAEIVDADGHTRKAQVVRLGTLYEQTVPFHALASVALKQGRRVIEAFGRPPIRPDYKPEWIRFAEVE